MKKLNKGFTLAEVTTALALVGVVSAMVMPIAVKNIQKRLAGPILGRAVEQIQLGCQNMIQLANSRKTDASFSDVLFTITERELGFSDNGTSALTNFATIAPVYLGLDNSPVPENQIRTILGNDDRKKEPVDSAIRNGRTYRFSRFPAGLSITGNSVINNNNNDIDTRTGYTLFIDTNGFDNRPNRIGTDIFGFDLLNNGTLLPTNIDADTRNFTNRVVQDDFKITY